MNHPSPHARARGESGVALVELFSDPAHPGAGSGLTLQKYLWQSANTNELRNLIPFIGKAASNLTGLKLRAEPTMRLEQVPSNHSLGAGTTGTCR